MDGRLNLTAGAFNQLGQHTSKGYCYAELTIFFPKGGRYHRHYSLKRTSQVSN